MHWCRVAAALRSVTLTQTDTFIANKREKKRNVQEQKRRILVDGRNPDSDVGGGASVSERGGTRPDVPERPRSAPP